MQALFNLKKMIAGSAIGNGFGYPTEFLKVDEIKKKWGQNGLTELLREINKGTDDRQIATAVSKALMNAYSGSDIKKEKFEVIIEICNNSKDRKE